MATDHGCAWGLFSRDRDLEARDRDVDNSGWGETETKAFRARDRDEAYQFRGETEPRHYCALRWPRDRGIKTKATSLPVMLKRPCQGTSLGCQVKAKNSGLQAKSKAKYHFWKLMQELVLCRLSDLVYPWLKLVVICTMTNPYIIYSYHVHVTKFITSSTVTCTLCTLFHSHNCIGLSRYIAITNLSITAVFVEYLR